MSKIQSSRFEVDTKKIENENGRPEKRKNEAMESKIPSIKKSSTKQQKHQFTNESKIFAIYEKRKMIEPLRKELLARGWIEQMSDDSLILPKFVWLARSNGIVIEGSPIVSRLRLEPRKNFCFKDILIDYGRSESNSDKSTLLNMPRTFKLFSNEKKEFMENYRLTAYASFIRFLQATGSKVFSESGKIDSKWINFAIKKLESAIALSDNKETNFDPTKQKLQETGSVFEKFKKVYQSVVKYDSKIAAAVADRKNLLQQCNVIYRTCKKVWKNFENDGFYNLWLLKPARRSLGIGIKLLDEDVDILCYAKDNADMKYLVQKYIGKNDIYGQKSRNLSVYSQVSVSERPLLIYNTKFDLRQYFLLVHHTTGVVCLWMYKMCYLKFSTKLYDPLNYKVSVHITNTAVQSKYSVDKNRSRYIPQCNEWSSDRFLAYLNKENKLTLWNNKIYPEMKKTIVAMVSVAMDCTVLQPNRFQLYGCDFVIDENYNPILLEINGLPILTSVICSMCLQDLVKVIIDTREDPCADTGNFERIWEKNF